VVGVDAGLFLGVHELVVDLDLEDTALGGHDRKVVDVELELFEDLVRQTDGPRCVPSLSAVFDGDSHSSSLFPARRASWKERDMRFKDFKRRSR
jgi:hypothetical protein